MNCFKSHRDKVQTHDNFYLCQSCQVSNPIGTKFKLTFDTCSVGYFLVSNPIGTKFKPALFFLVPLKKPFQIPQGQSSNKISPCFSAIEHKFQIPQGQSSNSIRLKWCFVVHRFKSHRDKVQTPFANTFTTLSSKFQIPQGQSSNSIWSLCASNLTCFKSHRDKVQTYFFFYFHAFTLVSNPIGTKFKHTAFHIISLDIVFQIPQGQSSNSSSVVAIASKKRFKSHRDKVQTCVLLEL